MISNIPIPLKISLKNVVAGDVGDLIFLLMASSTLC